MTGLPREGGRRSRFHLLLERLDRDPVVAERELERLRRALSKYFDWRGGAWPEDYADETIDRLARKLQEGAPIVDVGQFAHGIARLVLKEQARAEARFLPLDAHEPHPPPERDRGGEALLDQLETCLGRLSAEERGLVLRYYAGGQGRGKIAHRRELARELGVSDNALRSRVQRLRDRLEECVRRHRPRIGPRHESSGSLT